MSSCIICAEALGTTLQSLPCGHVYHRNCIMDWFGVSDRTARCPLCKAPTNVNALTNLEYNPLQILLNSSTSASTLAASSAASGSISSTALPLASSSTTSVASSLFSTSAVCLSYHLTKLQETYTNIIETIEAHKHKQQELQTTLETLLVSYKELSNRYTQVQTRLKTTEQNADKLVKQIEASFKECKLMLCRCFLLYRHKYAADELYYMDNCLKEGKKHRIVNNSTFNVPKFIDEFLRLVDDHSQTAHPNSNSSAFPNDSKDLSLESFEQTSTYFILYIQKQYLLKVQQQQQVEEQQQSKEIQRQLYDAQRTEEKLLKTVQKFQSRSHLLKRKQLDLAEEIKLADHRRRMARIRMQNEARKHGKLEDLEDFIKAKDAARTVARRQKSRHLKPVIIDMT